jgi:hypothetical protein
MKAYLFIAPLVAASFAVSGCADQSTATTSNTDPTQKNYSGQDLARTGQAQTGQALQQADPDVERAGRR